MSDDDFKIPGENDEEDIDPMKPLADDLDDGVEEVDSDLTGTEVPVSKAAKAGLLGDDVDEEDLEDEDDDESDPLDDVFEEEYEDEM